MREHAERLMAEALQTIAAEGGSGPPNGRYVPGLSHPTGVASGGRQAGQEWPQTQPSHPPRVSLGEFVTLLAVYAFGCVRFTAYMLAHIRMVRGHAKARKAVRKCSQASR